jgi:S-DNA-T family DNA segregation ATPase FtsK/SpoIIIE
MLYIPPELAKPVRVQGCFINDKEISRLIDHLKSQKTTEYNDEITSQPVAIPGSKTANVVSVDGAEHDTMFNDAVKFITDTGKASATNLQRHFKIGYARAARLLDELEQAKIVGPVNGAKPREILVPHARPSDGEI